MDKKNVKLLLGCVAKSAIENIPKILREIPAVGGIVSESYKAVIDGINDYEKRRKSDAKTVENIKKNCYQIIVEEAKIARKPEFMSCVIFPAINGTAFSREQQEWIDSILNLEVNGDEESIGVVAEFIDNYLGGSIYLNEDYEIGDNYISFNFSFDFGDEEYLYNEQPMISLVKAINNLLGQAVFKDYLIYE